MSKTTEYKEGRATVRIVYYTSKTLADGSHPFMVCITKDRKRKYLATGLSLLPKYWNAEKSNYRDAIRKSYPEPHREDLLTDLDKEERKYSKAATELARADEQHDAPAVAAKAVEGRKATRRVLLLAYIEELAQGMMLAKKLKNASVHRDLASQLRKFIKEEYEVADLPFERVSVAFCQEWENTLRATGAAETTISNRYRTLRAVFNKAIATGTAKPEHYPFARTVAEKHKFSIGKFDVSTAKRALPREAVERIEDLEPATDRQRLAKEVFLFSFYVGGINFVDLAQLRWQDMSFDANGQPERLHYVRQKTGGKFAFRLLEPAAAILMAYEPLTRASAKNYVFPILDMGRHVSPTQIDNRLHKVLGMVNKDLKVLAEQVGISTPLTTYVARHSFATTLHQEIDNIGMVSQAMGHKTAAVTATYLDSFASTQVDLALEGLLRKPKKTLTEP